MLQTPFSDVPQSVEFSPLWRKRSNDGYEQYWGAVRSIDPGFAAFPYRQSFPDQKVAENRFRILQGLYTALGSSAQIIEQLTEEPALHPVLMEAPAHIHDAFGKSTILQLRAQGSDEGDLLKVTIQLPVKFENAESALRKFDDSWWLDNCHRAGSLVFDYAIRDAV